MSYLTLKLLGLFEAYLGSEAIPSLQVAETSTVFSLKWKKTSPPIQKIERYG